MFFARVPSALDVERFLTDCRERPLSYSGSGPAGFQIDTETTNLGAGQRTFVLAVRALRAWRHFDLGWVRVFPPDAPLAAGVVVAVRIKHMSFWSLNGCRVASVFGSEHERSFGFTYRTLTNHAECGAETFTLVWDAATDAVSYTIHAISRPRSIVTKLGFPYVRVLQARFRRDSAQVLRQVIGA